MPTSWHAVNIWSVNPDIQWPPPGQDQPLCSHAGAATEAELIKIDLVGCDRLLFVGSRSGIIIVVTRCAFTEQQPGSENMDRFF